MNKCLNDFTKIHITTYQWQNDIRPNASEPHKSNATVVSSSRGYSSSALHSYSKRRFIRPFAPPCSFLLSPQSSLAGLSRGDSGKGGKAGNQGKAGWLEKAGRPVGAELRVVGGNFFNSIVQALVVVVVVVVVLFFFFLFIVVVVLFSPLAPFWLSPYSGELS
jgi:hypothetical protein